MNGEGSCGLKHYELRVEKGKAVSAVSALPSFIIQNCFPDDTIRSFPSHPRNARIAWDRQSTQICSQGVRFTRGFSLSTQQAGRRLCPFPRRVG